MACCPTRVSEICALLSLWEIHNNMKFSSLEMKEIQFIDSDGKNYERMKVRSSVKKMCEFCPTVKRLMFCVLLIPSTSSGRASPHLRTKPPVTANSKEMTSFAADGAKNE
ncbi:ribosomal protein L36 [Striga asiatica]|uniref:Ribosomal protein L36 n=1 Tax=Striga asiatica TaxID=4170 RepID=A0A5A7RBY5_STRAF|nr:ribosomal protein L36 [Striga asiatica]